MFIFYSKINEMPKKNYEVIVSIHKCINNKQDLFDLFATKLNFPIYFGKNWDALYDCLSDLTWMKEKRFLILHEDVPFHNMIKEKKCYINLLFDLKNSLKYNENLQIDIAFSCKYRNEIESVLNEHEF